MRTYLLVAMALVSTYIGFKWTAEMQLETRLGAVRDGARGLCMSRGSAVPTADEMRAHLVDLALERHVELSQVDVSVVALDAAHDTMGGAQVQAGFGGALQMGGTVAMIKADMFSKRWLWETNDVLEARCTLERTLQRVLPPAALAE